MMLQEAFEYHNLSRAFRNSNAHVNICMQKTFMRYFLCEQTPVKSHKFPNESTFARIMSQGDRIFLFTAITSGCVRHNGNAWRNSY